MSCDSFQIYVDVYMKLYMQYIGSIYVLYLRDMYSTYQIICMYVDINSMYVCMYVCM